MKILFLNAHSSGSIATIIRQVGGFLTNNSDDYIFLYGRGSKSTVKKERLVSNKLNLLIDIFRSRFFDNQGFNSKANTRKVIGIIKKERPDIVNIHNLHGYYINIKMLFEYLKTSNIPVVLSLHDCWTFTGHCAHFVSNNCTKWETGCNKCPSIKRYPKSYFCDNSERNWKMKKAIFSQFDFNIVVPSLWMARLVSDSFLKNKSVTIINNGIDTGVFNDSANPHKHHKEYFLAVANVWTDDFKGASYLFKIAEAIKPKYDLVVIGEWRMTNKPEGLYLVGNVKSKEEMASWYRGAAVFVNPTMADTYPVVNIEAQACGTNVVSFDSGGTPDTIFLPNSKVVKKGDINRLIQTSLDVAVLPKETIDFQTRNLFSRSKMASDYYSLFKTIIDGRGSGGN